MRNRASGFAGPTTNGSTPPLPGSFVVNAGELLELATNGYVRAAVHEVIAPPVGLERHSIAFFLGSRPDAVIPVIDLPEALREGQRGLSVDPLNTLFRNVGRNQLKIRLRSHPNVARAHYSDQINLAVGDDEPSPAGKADIEHKS